MYVHYTVTRGGKKTAQEVFLPRQDPRNLLQAYISAIAVVLKKAK
jgi:hypothetical protein